MLAVGGDRREADRERDGDDRRERARGCIFEENSGASTNSGLIRASTRKNAGDLGAAAELADQLTERQLAHPPTSCGIDMYRFCA